MNKLSGVFILFISLVFAASCKHRKPTMKNVTIDTTAVTKTHVDTTVIMPPPPVNAEKKELISQLTPIWQRHITFTTFNGKAKMRYADQSQSQEFTANFRIKKDSIIWVNVSASIFQVARIMITPDSIYFLNYLQREFTKLPFAQAAKLLPVTFDFATLQNFIVGNALDDSGAITDATDFGGSWTLQVNNPAYIQQLTYNKADSTMRTAQIKSASDTGTQAVVQYGNYQNIEGQRISTSRSVNLQNGNQQYYINMDFTKVDLNQEQDFPFNIPASYGK